MAARWMAVVAGLLAFAVAAPLPADLPSGAAAAEPAASYSAQELEQLVAPVALYPDELLGQILMAATYPLEIVEAARWLAVPANAALQGEALATALDAQDWDPSVKALVPFPQIVQMMNARLDWMQKLGDAFLAQQDAVMDAVQRLRQRAAAAGTLASTPQQQVAVEGPDILIAPVNPEIVYPPCYDAALVYGPWPYPGFPPYVLPLLPGCTEGPALFFGIGVAIVPALWGWNHCDWAHHRIGIDPRRFNAINRRAIEYLHRPPVENQTWQHDPYHRHGVAYGDPATRARFASPAPGAATRQEYRGYPASVPSAPAARPSAAPAAPHAVAPPAAERPVAPAYEGIGQGPSVRAQSERGYQSLRSMTPSAAPRAAPSFVPRAAPSAAPQGGARGGGAPQGGGAHRGR